MSAAVYVSFLVDGDNKHQSRAQAHRDGVIASVDIDAPGRSTIQATDPQALRNLAAVLIDAADQADALLTAKAEQDAALATYEPVPS